MTRPPDHPHQGATGDDQFDDRPGAADHDQARLLDAALDDLHRSSGAPRSAAVPAGLDPALAATARTVHATLAATRSDPRLRPLDKHLIWEDLMRSHASPGAETTRPAAATATSLSTGSGTFPVTAAARALGARSAGSADSAPIRLVPPRRAAGRQASPATRWLRHGWPAVELLGAAALILGIVAVIIGATGGDGPHPTQFAGVGDGTAVATPNGETVAAAGLPDPGNTGVMPGPGPEGQPDVIWRVPIEPGGPAGRGR